MLARTRSANSRAWSRSSDRASPSTVAGGRRTSSGIPGWSRAAWTTPSSRRTVASSGLRLPSGWRGGGPSMAKLMPTRRGRWAAA